MAPRSVRRPDQSCAPRNLWCLCCQMQRRLTVIARGPQVRLAGMPDARLVGGPTPPMRPRCSFACSVTLWSPHPTTTMAGQRLTNGERVGGWLGFVPKTRNEFAGPVGGLAVGFGRARQRAGSGGTGPLWVRAGLFWLTRQRDRSVRSPGIRRAALRFPELRQPCRQRRFRRYPESRPGRPVPARAQRSVRRSRLSCPVV